MYMLLLGDCSEAPSFSRKVFCNSGNGFSMKHSFMEPDDPYYECGNWCIVCTTSLQFSMLSPVFHPPPPSTKSTHVVFPGDAFGAQGFFYKDAEKYTRKFSGGCRYKGFLWRIVIVNLVRGLAITMELKLSGCYWVEIGRLSRGRL